MTTRVKGWCFFFFFFCINKVFKSFCAFKTCCHSRRTKAVAQPIVITRERERSYNIILRSFVERCIMHSKNKNTVQNKNNNNKKHQLKLRVDLLYARLLIVFGVSLKNKLQLLLRAYILCYSCPTIIIRNPKVARTYYADKRLQWFYLSFVTCRGRRIVNVTNINRTHEKTKNV